MITLQFYVGRISKYEIHNSSSQDKIGCECYKEESFKWKAVTQKCTETTRE